MNTRSQWYRLLIVGLQYQSVIIRSVNKCLLITSNVCQVWILIQCQWFISEEETKTEGEREGQRDPASRNLCRCLYYACDERGREIIQIRECWEPKSYMQRIEYDNNKKAQCGSEWMVFSWIGWERALWEGDIKFEI